MNFDQGDGNNFSESKKKTCAIFANGISTQYTRLESQNHMRVP